MARGTCARKLAEPCALSPAGSSTDPIHASRGGVSSPGQLDALSIARGGATGGRRRQGCDKISFTEYQVGFAKLVTEVPGLAYFGLRLLQRIVADDRRAECSVCGLAIDTSRN